METNIFKRRFDVSNFLSFSVLLFLILGAGYYLYDHYSCGHPVLYSIGTFDTRFQIDKGNFLATAKEAADLWNKEAGKPVLVYDPQGPMTVNLIYDARQQQTNAGESIGKQQAVLAAQKEQVQALQSQYDAARRQYRTDQAASKDISTLNAEVETLNQMGDELRSAADRLNTKIAQLNTQARSYNSQTGSDFNEGEYLQQYGIRKVNVYEFKSHTQLVRVLAHEFGHSLGMEHNANPDSIMYPVNTAATVALTPEDKAALADACTFSFTKIKLPF
jgi:predicted Zn-dependent protease